MELMQALFIVVYLITAITLGLFMVMRGKRGSIHRLFGTMALVLGCGDAFHLIPRAYALLTDGVGNHAALLGAGTFITSITMTVFYVLLYHIWRKRYQVDGRPILTWLVYGLALVRTTLCCFPQNQWLSADAPIVWGIWRNIPFVLIGLLLICLFAWQTHRQKDRGFRYLWLAIVLSFVFYIPVVLWAQQLPPLGALMIPKTLAYVWILIMGYRDMPKYDKS